MQVALLMAAFRWRPISTVTVATLLTMTPLALALDDRLLAGTSYRIVRPVYLMAIYDNVTDRRDANKPARAYLQPERYAKTRWVAFQCEVPVGTIVTILRPAPPARDLWHRFDAYFVKMSPSVAGDLDVIVQLFRGFGDGAGNFNASFFEPVQGAVERESEDAKCIESKN